MSSNNANATTTAPVTATIKSRPNVMPSSYLYTSSSALLNRNSENKPAPPPTLPKYTSSFNAGSGLNRDRDKDSIGGSYRLSSLDRLAMRNKFMEQQSPTNGTPQTNGDTNSGLAAVQNKRDTFFSNSSGKFFCLFLTNKTHFCCPFFLGLFGYACTSLDCW